MLGVNLICIFYANEEYGLKPNLRLQTNLEASSIIRTTNSMKWCIATGWLQLTKNKYKKPIKIEG